MTLSIPLHAGASNHTFARIWPLIQKVHDTFQPDYIVLQCGVDGLAGDPCGIWNWGLGTCKHNSEDNTTGSEEEGCSGEPEAGSLGWYITQILQWPGKKLFLGGGMAALRIFSTHTDGYKKRRIQYPKCSTCVGIPHFHYCIYFFLLITILYISFIPKIRLLVLCLSTPRFQTTHSSRSMRLLLHSTCRLETCRTSTQMCIFVK